MPVTVPGPQVEENPPTVLPLEPEQVTVEARRSLAVRRPTAEATWGSAVKNNTELAARITPMRTR
jgi:hypothetical protein